MKIEVARHRLLFKRPFTTAHGTRNGTDSVFVRITDRGFTGYGEATLPPYLEESADDVVRVLASLDLEQGIDDDGSSALISEIEAKTTGAPAACNAITMAVFDILGQMAGEPLWRLWGYPQPPGGARAMVTLACNDPAEVQERLKELPASQVLKVKLGTPHDLELLREVIRLDHRALLLDANQGLQAMDEAMRIIEFAGDRAVAIEQPFHKDNWLEHARLRAAISIPVIGDESIQGMADLERAANVFGGVNVKLMKCGGLAQAGMMIRSAQRLGLKVMLGSMSESSLGSLAMMHLSGSADLLDVDGPWLIANDPFEGMGWAKGVPQTPREPGIGARLITDLPFAPIRL